MKNHFASPLRRHAKNAALIVSGVVAATAIVCMGYLELHRIADDIGAKLFRSLVAQAALQNSMPAPPTWRQRREWY